MIDLDHNATAPLHPAVREAMVAALSDARLGNPSSLHARGRHARARIEASRRAVAASVGADPRGVIFTSGATEANALALRRWGALERGHGVLRSTLSGPLEHASCRAGLDRLTQAGHTARSLVGDEDGVVTGGSWARVWEGARDARAPVGLLCLAWIDGELGVRQPLDRARTELRGHAPSAWWHCDLVQAWGRTPVDVQTLGVDSAAISAHKIGGPAGVGAWIVTDPATCQWPGGDADGYGQERGLRAGTENLLGIVGMGAAAEHIPARLAAMSRVHALRERLAAGVRAIEGARVLGDDAHSAGTTVAVRLCGCDAQLVLAGLDLRGVAVSAGSACSSGSPEPSPGLRAIGLSEGAAREVIRLSLGPEHTRDDIDRALAALTEVVTTMRAAGDGGGQVA